MTELQYINLDKGDVWKMERKKNKPFVFWDECEFCELENGVKRKILAYSESIMHVEVHFEDESIGDMHSHPHEQTTYVISGEFEFTIGDETRVVKRGDTMYYESNVMHGCRCIKAGVLLDTFTPMRKDFL